MKKNALLVLPILFVVWSTNVLAEYKVKFQGKKFTATITSHCDEGNVSCDDVTYQAKNNNNGKSITLAGKTVNSNCPAVCDFRGYEFKNGPYRYSLLSGNRDKWMLSVFKNGKLVTSDTGLVN